MTRPFSVLVAVVVLAVGAAGCGERAADVGQEGKAIKAIDAGVVPAQLLGLTVNQEPAEEYVADIDRSYLERFGLYSLRRGDVLEATLQLSKFGEDADYDKPEFRATVVGRIGKSNAQLLRMGDTEVYMTTGTKQQIAVWFRGPHMAVLSMRDQYPTPRTLLRQALAVKL